MTVPYLVNVALAVSATLAMYLAWYSWRKSTIPGRLYFSWLMLAVAEYSLAVSMELLSSSIPAKVFWSKIEFAGAASVPTLWLLVALSFGQHNRFLTLRWVLFVWIFPAISFILALTNEWHRLIWTDVRIVTAPLGQVAVYEHGPAFWLSMACCQLAVVLGFVTLIGAAFRSPRHQRMQLFILGVAALAPWCANMISLAGLHPLRGLEHAQFAFVLTGVLLAWSILRYGMLQIMPLAYDVVFRSMSEGVIMADAHGQIVEINPAVEQILGLRRDVIGKPVNTVLSKWLGLLQLKTGTIELEPCPSGSSPEAQWLEATSSALTDTHGQIIGSLLLIRDITERKQTEQRLTELRNALADRVRELEEASAHIKTLQGIVPICMYCHKIRTDQESWQQLEIYIQQHSDAQFSHGLCPECAKKHFPKKNPAN
ncbi:MAG TPA: histidine kinase N-terminal 7TM domain-containing protein [Candidatus Hydrogenedentes bacterium]|nr:histidine kinase N-terminal 7TM domain-containing protein [Candidatus Hydrogenedentota bacterium]